MTRRKLTVNEGSSKDKKRKKTVMKKASKPKTNSLFSKKSSKSPLTTHPASDVDGSEEQPSARKLVILSTTDNEQYVEEVKDVEIPEVRDESPIEMVQNVEVDISGYLGTEPLGGTAVLDAGAEATILSNTAKKTVQKGQIHLYEKECIIQ